MTRELSIRKLIKSYLDSKKTGSEIYQLLNKTVKKRTIYNWIERIKKRKSIEAKVSKGRPRTIRTKRFIRKIEKNCKSGIKRKSARQLAKESNCNPQTVLNVIHDDLKFKTYKPIEVPALTSNHIEQRSKFSIWIRNHFTKETCRKILFSDEKIFDGDGQINPKNDVVYAENREQANNTGGLKPKHKYPYKVMVWIGLTYNGPTELVILPPKTSFDSIFYIKNVLPIVNRDGKILIGTDFVFQQDKCSVHTSNDSQNSFKIEVPSMIGPNTWPANSPDLNPLDYFFWNEVSSRLKKKSFCNREELIKKLKETIKEIPLKMIQDAIDEFRSRVYEVEKNKGGLILNKFS